LLCNQFKGSTVGYLSKANWLHKVTRSTNILFRTLTSEYITTLLPPPFSLLTLRVCVRYLHQTVQEAFSNKSLWDTAVQVGTHVTTETGSLLFQILGIHEQHSKNSRMNSSESYRRGRKLQEK